jgi:hypothetical protein
MTESPLRSRAQHAMLTKAAADPEYAKSRGIEQMTAQSLLDQHKAAGEPELVERVKAGEARSLRAGKTKTFGLLGS